MRRPILACLTLALTSLMLTATSAFFGHRAQVMQKPFVTLW